MQVRFQRARKTPYLYD